MRQHLEKKEVLPLVTARRDLEDVRSAISQTQKHRCCTISHEEPETNPQKQRAGVSLPGWREGAGDGPRKVTPGGTQSGWEYKQAQRLRGQSRQRGRVVTAHNSKLATRPAPAT